MRILIVEDERALCDAIARSLRNLAYSVDCCYDGQEALDLLGVEVFDLVVLDLNLPRIDGMTVLRELRKTDCETKVLVLSARGEEYDKIHGFELGIDDYVVKPFSPRELMMRVKVVISRNNKKDVRDGHEIFQAEGLVVDFTGRTVTVDGKWKCRQKNTNFCFI